jgi:asparagine synthase (glutamine-hydrolysing)
MCGIAGSFGPRRSDSLIEKMLGVLAHRGSRSPNVVASEDATLGHTRLPIIGGDSSVQPLVVDHVLLTFNGEIYNYLDLRTDLMRRGCRFKTKGDVEVLANAYLVYGDVFVEKLRGIFAFALYDAQSRRLILCRDRMGVKPLYYTKVEDMVYFASELKALYCIPGFVLSINELSLCEYLHFQYTLEDRTMLEGVFKVVPGTFISFRGSEQKRNRYWEIPFSVVRSHAADYHTVKYYEDKLLSILHDSVRSQVPTVPFGVYLSGGLDSSTVAALAAQYSDNFKIITGRYDVVGYDETEFSRAVAEKMGFLDNFTVFDISEDDAVNALPDALYHLDEPVVGPGLIGQYVLAKKLKEAYPDIVAMLGGQGGDELFGGYARYIVAYLESCIYGAIYPDDKDYVLTLAKIVPILPVLQGYEPMLQSFSSSDMFQPREHRYYSLVGRTAVDRLNPEFYGDVYSKHSDCLFATYSEFFDQLGSVSYFTKMMFFDAVVSLPALLQVDDRVNGAFEMEGRVPLLDEKLVEFAFSVPPVHKFAGGYSKGLLRQVMGGWLPDMVLERRDKKGFPVPLDVWMDSKGSFYEFVNETLKTSPCKSIFSKSGTKFDRAKWGELSLALWANKYKLSF